MELKINGEIAELGNSLPAITKRGIDPSNLSVRFLETTNQFIIPNSTRNRKLIGATNLIGSDNTPFEESFNIQVSDISQIFKGIGFVVGATQNEITIQGVSDSKNLIDAFNVKIRDLDYTGDWVHLTDADITAYDALDISFPFYWGKMCNHEDASREKSDQATYLGEGRTAYSRPVLYLNSVIKKLCDNEGYTYTNNEKNLCVTLNAKDFFFTDYYKIINDTISGFYTKFNIDNFSSGFRTVLSNSIQVNATKFKLRIKGQMIASADNVVVISQTSTDVNETSNTRINVFEGINEIDILTNDFSATGTSDLKMIVSSGSVDFENVEFYTVISEKESGLDLSTNPFNGMRIMPYENFPETTVLDIIKLFNVVNYAYPDIDLLNKQFSFTSFNQFSKLNIEDWSDQFVIDSEKINSSVKLAKKNILKYTNDLTVSKKEGEGYFFSQKDYIEDEKDYLTLPYGATKDSFVYNDTVACQRVYSDTARLTDNEVNTRLLYANDDTLTFSEISFSTLVSNEYANFLNSMSRLRVVNAEFNLKKTDIINFKPEKLVYVDYFKTTFIILEISNYINGRTTKVKMMAYGR